MSDTTKRSAYRERWIVMKDSRRVYFDDGTHEERLFWSIGANDCLAFANAPRFSENETPPREVRLAAKAPELVEALRWALRAIETPYVFPGEREAWNHERSTAIELLAEIDHD